MFDKPLLIGDIGGTNARFAIAQPDDASYSKELVLLCENFDSAELAIEHYLQEVGSARPQGICLAVAGPVTGGTAKLTNNSWTFNEQLLGDSYSCEKVRLLNDFEAIALGLVELRADEITFVGSVEMPHEHRGEFTLAVVGPGTGLGAATLVKRQGQLFPLSCEAGHVGFAPESVLQVSLLQILGEKFGRVSDERLVSGVGLVNLYNALANIRGVLAEDYKAADVFASADSDPLARESIDIFFELLGQVSGNFVLSAGAFDGLYIGGGIIRRYPDLLQSSAFRNGFENKGRHSVLMREVPTALVNHPYPGLLGAAALARSWF